MSKPHILISGAGIAGPVCAYFLTLSGIHTTIIERSPTLRKSGQQIDIRGPAVQVIKRMGVEEIIRANTTKEAGLAFVDTNGKRRAEFAVDEDGGMGFTSDIEILRGELSKIFYDTSKDNTEYVFGDHVTGLEEQGSKIKVTLASGDKRLFDLVIGADGMSSKIRRLAFPEIENPLKSLGQYTAFFTIPYKESDGTFAQWYNAPRGRSILLRPDGAGGTRVYLSIISSSPSEYEKLNVSAQKEMIRGLFSDAGWDSLRILEAMEKADDFYMTEIAQIKMSHWHQGRVALLGDAGYCPSPMSGMGTTLAIVGAYILAGEIGNCNVDYAAGLKAYEEKMMPYVKKAQALPPGVPWIVNPQTQWGISILHSVLGVVSWSGIPKWFSKLSRPPAEDKSFPKYAF